MEYKFVLFTKKAKWYGKLYLRTVVRQNPEHVHGQVEIKGELMQLLKSTN